MRVLLTSGVSIGTGISPIYEQGPTPDYVVLRERLKPDILDVDSLPDADGWLSAVLRRLDPCWGIALAAFHRRESYDVIAATGEDVGFRLALICKMSRSKIPLVVGCHNIATRRPRFFLKQLGVGSHISVFQCLAEKQIAMLAEQMPLAPGQAQPIYCGVDHEFFRPRPDAVVVKNQICSAGMASRDYATLVEAVAPIANVDLKIAADSPWFKQSLNISDSDLSPRVEVRSYKTYVLLRELYATSYAVVVPLLDVPYSAGYSVILEAMAMGKAVIVTRITQKDDFVVDGWNGLYTSPGNVEELRQKIKFLMDNPDEVARMGANARKTVEDRFTLNHYADRFLRTIESAALGASDRKISDSDVTPGGHATAI